MAIYKAIEEIDAVLATPDTLNGKKLDDDPECGHLLEDRFQDSLYENDANIISRRQITTRNTIGPK
jgi:hypothetical protein